MLDWDKPPASNTGALNTCESGMRACVDWVQATFNLGQLVPVFELLNMRESDFGVEESGQYGYRKMRRCGHIKIYYDGNENMGIHIEMSGQGCREFESAYPYSWTKFFFDVLKFGHFTRLDCAVDDFMGYFSIETIRRKIKKAECISKFRKARAMQTIDIASGRDEGTTVYLGHPQSRIKIRFYDKLAERKSAGKEIAPGVKCWNRTEIQMKNERADAFALYLIQQYDNNKDQSPIVGEGVKRVLKNYVKFVNRTADTNKQRWPECTWWKKFLGQVEKLRLTEVAPDKTLEQSKEWYERQVSKTFAKIYMAVTTEDPDYFARLLEYGQSKFTDHDRWQIENYIRKIREGPK